LTTPDDHRAKPGYTLAAAMSGYALDGFDLLMVGFMLGPISAELGLSGAQAGSLVTWTLIGGAVGGSIFGTLADYFGRARVLSISILVFALFTFLCAFAVGPTDLFIYRVLAGLGLGCEFGVGVVMATEAYPPHLRARVSSYVGLSWQFGVLAAALLTPLLLPHIGWRGMFLLGGLPAVASFFIRKHVPESEDFKESRSGTIGRIPLKPLWETPRAARHSAAILIMSTIQNFGYYGLIVWLPSYLVKVRHFTGQSSGLWTAFSVAGMIVGVFLFGVISRNLGQKRTFLFYQCGAGAVVLIYSALTTPTQLLFGGFAAGFFVNGMMGGYGALVTSLYPVHARSTAQNVLWSIGRALGGLSPMVIGTVVARGSFPIALGLLSVLYAVDFIVTVAMIPKNADKAARETASPAVVAV